MPESDDWMIRTHEVNRMRRDWKLWLIATPLCIWPMAANADDGEAAKLIAECSAADLPQTSLDSCLERVRVLEETDSSPPLQTLEATLEQRASGRPVRTRATAAPAPRTAEAAPTPNEISEAESEQAPSFSQPEQPDSSAPRSGVALEDEPPVSDPPDGTDRTDDNSNDPPQS